MGAQRSAGTKRTRLAVDWVYVRYRTLALAGLLVLLAAGTAAWYWLGTRDGEAARAAQAVQSADRVVAEAGKAVPDAADLGEARRRLTRAHEELAARRYAPAIDEARGAEELAQAILGEQPASGESGVRVVRVDGDVRLKRAGQFLWEELNDRAVLRSGDQVRTGANATARLVYFDGTSVSVEPGTLLEIRDLVRDDERRTQRVSERLAWGALSASKQDPQGTLTTHEISTESASVQARKAAEFRVRHDRESGVSEVVSYRGELTLRSEQGEVPLPESTRVELDRGRIVSRAQLLDPPRLTFPPDQRTFLAPSQARVSAGWSAVDRAKSYRVQLAEDQVFSRRIVDFDRNDAAAVEFPALSPGTYYWRVMAVDAAGNEGLWSESRKFRVLGAEFRDPEDRQAPVLDVSEILVVGSNAIVSGRTEPGALVWVDGERVDLDDDGRFTWLVKLKEDGRNRIQFLAQDAAGNEARRTGFAYVDAF